MGHILAGDAEYVLVIWAETLSRFVDLTDRNTCILFGDGAVRWWLPATYRAASCRLKSWQALDQAMRYWRRQCHCRQFWILYGGHYMQTDGKAVFRFATRVMAEATQRVLARAG